jgi:hypothetical protein
MAPPLRRGQSFHARRSASLLTGKRMRSQESTAPSEAQLLEEAD